MRTSPMPGSGLDRRVAAPAPFGPRAVIDRDLARADEVQAEGKGAVRNAGAAARNNRLVGIDAGGAEFPCDRVGGYKVSGGGIGNFAKRKIPGPGNVPA